MLCRAASRAAIMRVAETGGRSRASVDVPGLARHRLFARSSLFWYGDIDRPALLQPEKKKPGRTGGPAQQVSRVDQNSNRRDNWMTRGERDPTTWPKVLFTCGNPAVVSSKFAHVSIAENCVWLNAL